ncbi:acetyl-CoA carboxylase biotin carboxyl carrier protein [Chryseomicrobium palamuruense]|uniref:Biotin carboxyl carrier protein of acetyl-CoA carboxylase n=1 Tax=Chryseomicrobium palamuruense TaxID=682973 RepID=A0ABV8V0I3_9BACL
MKIQEIREIIKLMDQSTLDEFVFEAEGTKLKLKKHNGETRPTVHTSAQPQEQPAAVVTPKTDAPKVEAAPAEPIEKQESTSSEASSSYKTITSPMVGTFYSSSSPEADSYVKVGDRVNADTIVCIVEAMKLFNEIEAEIEGEIAEIHVKDGQLVEYGQPLFSIK